MDVAEFETLVNELETRVDRLRSLYEQYFMGIEKMIPGVATKDVERRIQALRRDQPRNTGLRFRFQMIIQRYNTYQSYWQRTVRQIEEGTYKRDIMRAKKRFEQDVAIKEVPKADAGVDAAPVEKTETNMPAVPVPPAAAAVQTGRTVSGSYVLNLDEEMNFDEPEAETKIKPPVPQKPLAKPAPPAPIAKPPTPIAKPAAPPPIGASSAFAKTQWRKVGDPPPAPAVKAPIAAAKPSVPIEKPKPEMPAVRPAPAAPVAAAAAPKPAPIPPKSAPKAGSAEDERMRQIYSQYVQTKRAHNESTAQITYENLAKTIRESTAKLKEKHAGKSIDFEVAVKDGKTVLKPVVK